MVRNPKTKKTKKATSSPAEQSAPAKVADAADIESLWLDPKLGDGIVSSTYHTIAVGKPRDFFRTVPDPSYRRRGQIYIHKVEGIIDEQVYVIAPNMQGEIEEAMPCTLVTVVNRDGTPRLWVIKHPKEGKHDNDAWVSARSAAKVGMDKWIKLVWEGRAYKTRDAMPGYAPDPDYSKLPSFDELVRLAFGEHGIIRDRNHPIYRELFGAPPTRTSSDDGDL
jgi:hypothetical protein